MEPVSLGRRLGVGMRIAARSLRTRAEEEMRKPVPSSGRENISAQGMYDAASQARPSKAQTKATAVTRGARRFGEAIWGPMAHTGGVLWLEITGLFFALFALFFGQNVYRLRHAYADGPDHIRFLLYSAVTLVFIYFTFSSFYKARRKERRKSAERSPR